MHDVPDTRGAWQRVHILHVLDTWDDHEVRILNACYVVANARHFFLPPVLVSYPFFT